MKHLNTSHETIRISELSQPFVVKNSIGTWKALKYTESDWCKEFGDELLIFRKGKKCVELEPYWERNCKEAKMSLNDFFNYKKSDDNFWLYFDYKHMRHIFDDNKSILQDVDWSNLGLDLSGKDSTIWIGHQDAHTPCHMDSYGCNLVAQIYGRKKWVLMPPSETVNLCPVRVPYEESSVYSSFNFFTPNENILGVNEAYEVVLDPGDVLYVPRHWWHYVENLCTAISINTWVPLAEDNISRLDEAIVQSYVASMCQELTQEQANCILNPNEDQRKLLDLTMFQALVQNCKDSESSSKTISCRPTALNTTPLAALSMKDYLKQRQQELKYKTCDVKVSQRRSDQQVATVEALINSVCSPDCITLVRTKLLQHFNL